MKFDARTKQIIEMFSDSRAYSPLMSYQEVFKYPTKKVAKIFYDKVKKYDHRVEKKKYFDKLTNETNEAWFIQVRLKHSIIEAFFYPVGNKTYVTIVRKDKPYITALLGAGALAIIILLGKLLMEMSLSPVKLLTNFAIIAGIIIATIVVTDRLALPKEMREAIQSFDADLYEYKDVSLDEKELNMEIEKTQSDAAKELEEEK